jgi:hypothetical protein
MTLDRRPHLTAEDSIKAAHKPQFSGTYAFGWGREKGEAKETTR